MNDGTFTINGVTLGEPPYTLTRAPTGILSTADVRTEDRARPRRHGVTPGDDLLAGKLLGFEVAVLGADADDSEQLAVALAAAFAPGPLDTTLLARVSGTPSEYAYFGRPRGADILLDHALFEDDDATIYARCSFLATDPIRYGADEVQASIQLDAVGDGLMYPVEYPIVYTGASGVGQVTMINAGTAHVDWTATLTGPLTNPRLELADTGQDVELAATLAAGETVVLDSASGSILLGGTAPRPSWFATGSSWFQVGPGSNVIRLTADAGTGAADISFRSGWI